MKKILITVLLLTLMLTLIADKMSSVSNMQPLPNGKPMFQATHSASRDNGSGIRWEMPFDSVVIHNSNYYDYYDCWIQQYSDSKAK